LLSKSGAANKQSITEKITGKSRKIYATRADQKRGGERHSKRARVERRTGKRR